MKLHFFPFPVAFGEDDAPTEPGPQPRSRFDLYERVVLTPIPLRSVRLALHSLGVGHRPALRNLSPQDGEIRGEPEIRSKLERPLLEAPILNRPRLL